MLYKPNSERTKGPWIRRLFRYREWLIGEGYFGGSLASSVPCDISSVIISGGSSGWDSSAHDGARPRHAGTPRPDRRSCLGRGLVASTSLAHRFLHERGDPCLFGGSQPLQREGDRPHGPFVEVRLVAEAERRVPCLELIRCLEVADDLVVLRIRGHPVPEPRREGWRAGFDDSMEPLGHRAIRFRQLGNLRQHDAFPVRLVRLQLLDALLHRASFLVRESPELLAGRGDALGGLLRALLCRFHGILFVFRT